MGVSALIRGDPNSIATPSMKQQPDLAFANNSPIGCQLASVPPTTASRRPSNELQSDSYGRKIMLKKIKIVSAIVVIGGLPSLDAMQDRALAQKTAVPKPQDKLALGEDEVKQLLLLMDTNKTGKITKQEWMKFMETEFDRLDKDKRGELDAGELAQSRLRVSPFSNVGK